MSPTANRDLIMEIIYHNVTALTGLAEMFRSEWDQGSTTSEHTSPNESHTARSAWYCQTERRASGLMQWHIKTNSGKLASEDCKHAILFVTQVGIDTQQMFIEESRIRSLIQLAGSVWHHRMHLKKKCLDILSSTKIKLHFWISCLCHISKPLWRRDQGFIVNHLVKHWVLSAAVYSMVLQDIVKPHQMKTNISESWPHGFTPWFNTKWIESWYTVLLTLR